MGIFVIATTDPLSAHALAVDTPSAARPVWAESEAGRILHGEMTRYCSGRTVGRSFLIAGHRGAGKTTMVTQTLTELIRKARTGELELRPLPVMLHGPSLFQSLPDSALADRSERPTSTIYLRPRISTAEPPASSVEERVSTALIQVLLGLHRAVVQDFGDEFRRSVVRRLPPAARSPADAAELAAQFEIELTENPTAMRLREFWSHAGALDSGVLFDRPRASGQGGRELVALNGMCSAHQRVSGTTESSDRSHRKSDQTRSTALGIDLRALDAMKPIAAVLSGAVVGGGVAASSAVNVPGSLLLGLLTAFTAATVLRRATTTDTKRGRTLDTTFIPDLSASTLDRVLPMLLARLRAAGLAPVFVIDELDKVPRLSERLDGLVRYLKKLVAETVFTCFLTDRGYHEYLRVDGRHSAYSVASSYFSHRLLVAFWPSDFDAYLDRLLKVDSAPQDTTPATDTPADAGETDRQILKWVLRHRSKMHALDLARELRELGDDRGVLQVRPSTVRSVDWRIEVTLQVAIELQLTTSSVIGWNSRRPEMRQTLFDALYYLSRQWLDGKEAVDVSDAGLGTFFKDLQQRMNLDEVVRDEPEESSPRLDRRRSASVNLSTDDQALLAEVLRGIVRFLGSQTTMHAARDQWAVHLREQAGFSGAVAPSEDIFNVLLLEKQSLIIQPTDLPVPKTLQWRYRPSGVRRSAQGEVGPQRDTTAIHKAAQIDRESVLTYLRAVAGVLGVAPSGDEPPDRGLRLLDEAGLLRPLPPVGQAIDAIRALESRPASDSAGSGELEEALRTLKSLRVMLRTQARQIRDALIAAAFLGGVAGPSVGERGPATREGLRHLSLSLRITAHSERTLDLLAAFGAQVEQRFGVQLPSVPSGKDEYRRLKQLSTDVDAAYAQGLDVARAISGSPLTAGSGHPSLAAAWAALRDRAVALIGTGVDRPLTAEEIIWTARKQAPMALLGVELAKVSLPTWSKLLWSGLDAIAGDRRADGAARQPWLCAYALLRLGLDSIGAAQRARIANSLASQPGLAADEREALEEVLARGRVMTSEQRPTCTALIGALDHASLTDSWIDTPTRGLVLILRPTEFDKTRIATAIRLGLLSAPLIVVWEQPVTIIEKLQSSLVELRQSVPTASPDHWMYDRPTPQAQTPSIVAPLDANAVLSYGIVPGA